MSTATATLQEVAVLRHQARAVHRVVQLNVDGITQEESLIQPAPGGNCLNWVVGHLLATYDGVLPLLGQERVMAEGALERYARGTSPLQDPGEALDFTELLAAWDQAAPRIDAGLASLTEEALDRRAPMSPTGNPDETVRSLLAVVAFHQAYHAGQTGVLRRIAGKEGAIR